jgi:hypothetical protein
LNNRNGVSPLFFFENRYTIQLTHPHQNTTVADDCAVLTSVDISPKLFGYHQNSLIRLFVKEIPIEAGTAIEEEIPGRQR